MVSVGGCTRAMEFMPPGCCIEGPVREPGINASSSSSSSLYTHVCDPIAGGGRKILAGENRSCSAVRYIQHSANHSSCTDFWADAVAQHREARRSLILNSLRAIAMNCSFANFAFPYTFPYLGPRAA
jgi:hypothetical protein